MSGIILKQMPLISRDNVSDTISDPNKTSGGGYLCGKGMPSSDVSPISQKDPRFVLSSLYRSVVDKSHNGL